VVCSEQARSYKPAPGLFRYALEVIGLTPADVLHVGDSLHADVGGARKAGIDVVWVCRDRRIHDIGSATPNHKISSLKGLREFLE
jgi:FMN phosphatase YigB (HAD superfamily)